MTESPNEPCSPCEVAAALAYYVDVADSLGLNGASMWERATQGDADVNEVTDFLKVVRAKAEGNDLANLEALDEAMRSDLPNQLKLFRECVLISKDDQGFEEAVRICQEGNRNGNGEG